MFWIWMEGLGERKHEKSPYQDDTSRQTVDCGTFARRDGDSLFSENNSSILSSAYNEITRLSALHAACICHLVRKDFFF
jgi:hypothetical protein